MNPKWNQSNGTLIKHSIEGGIDRKASKEVSLLKNELDLAYHIQEDDKNAIHLEQLNKSNYIDAEGNPNYLKHHN